MALTLVQLGPAHRGVRCDRVHEVVYPGPPGPVLEKGFVRSMASFLMLHQIQGAGANRLRVDFLRRAVLSMTSAFSFDCSAA